MPGLRRAGPGSGQSWERALYDYNDELTDEDKLKEKYEHLNTKETPKLFRQEMDTY